MTVAELIVELQRFGPGRPVCVLQGTIVIPTEQGECEIDLDPSDATAADDVRDEGAFVLIRGR
ncbi:MAG: hypothetical protein QM702_00145 [Rubrivivax sp.]